jgi:AcrR family transcriptional regulator
MDSAPETRRARQRRELLAEIEEEARRQLVAGGPTTVSLRAIARAVGLSPASLYTYVASLDDIFTMLLLSSYRSLAAATREAAESFADAPPVDRALAAVLAHRRWALEHPGEFNLIFSDQLPGYEAPPDGPTVAAQVEVFQPIVDALAPITPADPELGPDQLLALVWGAFHGLVMLEINHHVQWVTDIAAVHEASVRRAFTAIGLPSPSSDVRSRLDALSV